MGELGSRPSSRVVDDVLDLLHEVGPVRPVPHEDVLPALCNLTGSESAVWHVVDSVRGPTTRMWPFPERHRRAEELMREYRDAHPLLCHYAQDPSMAILHSDLRHRDSFVYDVIEPLRAPFARENLVGHRRRMPGDCRAGPTATRKNLRHMSGTA